MHAYKFDLTHSHVTLTPNELFNQCKFFPNEFSVFFIIKHSRTYTGKECLLVIENDSIILSIQINRRYIFFIYKDNIVRFRNRFLRDNKWHTLGFSLGGSHVTMTTDCINRKHKRLKRGEFPDSTIVTNSNITIGSCSKSDVFQVSMIILNSI